jgi:hypothetical protein
MFAAARTVRAIAFALAIRLEVGGEVAADGMQVFVERYIFWAGSHVQSITNNFLDGQSETQRPVRFRTGRWVSKWVMPPKRV